MKKAIKGAAELIGVILFIIGIVICLCETADFGDQLVSLCVGFGMVCAGAVIGAIASRGDENVLD